MVTAFVVLVLSLMGSVVLSELMGCVVLSEMRQCEDKH